MPDDTGGRTDVMPVVIFLGKLVEYVAAGKIRVPRFQRAFVWKQTDLHDLLDSVLRGFPIGSILIWDTETPIESASTVGPIRISSPPGGQIGYLLDGQQRVSTLVGTLRLPDEAEPIVDDVNWQLYCDLDSREFLPIPLEKIEPRHFPVRSLLDTAGFITGLPPHRRGGQRTQRGAAVAYRGRPVGERVSRLPASSHTDSRGGSR